MNNYYENLNDHGKKNIIMKIFFFFHLNFHFYFHQKITTQIL